MPRERGQKLVASNKRARYDYFIEDVYEAGIVLSGTEVKSLREGKASLNDSYAVVDAGEVWLENAFIPEFSQGSWTNHATRRRRKLLLGKKEIAKLAGASRDSAPPGLRRRESLGRRWAGPCWRDAATVRDSVTGEL